MKVAALISKLVFFFRVKKIWRKPEQAPVLIYDRTGAGMFLHYIHPKHVHILDVRRETLNIYVLCLAILNYKKKGNIALSYKELYIQCVSPLVCLTFIDNDVQFYRLGLERVVKVFVQNGVRVDDESDIFGQLKKLSERQVYFVDYMCVFGASVGKKYLDYIRGELLTIGSLKNNLYECQKNVIKGTVVFISQYVSGHQKEFFAEKVAILSFLEKYTMQHGLKLLICARSNDTDSKEEYLYFESLLGKKNNWEFLPKKNIFSGYDYIDASEYVVSIDSTLGYEALARGKRVAIFSLRAERKKIASFGFGWPVLFPEVGPFWSNRMDTTEFERVMNYLMTVENEEWEKVSYAHMEEVMNYDPGNTQFLALMRQLKVPLMT